MDLLELSTDKSRKVLVVTACPVSVDSLDVGFMTGEVNDVVVFWTDQFEEFLVVGFDPLRGFVGLSCVPSSHCR